AHVPADRRQRMARVSQARGRPSITRKACHFAESTEAASGGFAGSAAMTALLSLHFGAFASTLICSVLIVIAMVPAWLLRMVQAQQGPLFVMPHAIVLLQNVRSGGCGCSGCSDQSTWSSARP